MVLDPFRLIVTTIQRIGPGIRLIHDAIKRILDPTSLIGETISLIVTIIQRIGSIICLLHGCSRPLTQPLRPLKRGTTRFPAPPWRKAAPQNLD